MAHFNFAISQNAKWGHAGFYIDCHRMTVPENILLQKKQCTRQRAGAPAPPPPLLRPGYRSYAGRIERARYETSRSLASDAWLIAATAAATAACLPAGHADASVANIGINTRTERVRERVRRHSGVVVPSFPVEHTARRERAGRDETSSTVPQK